MPIYKLVEEMSYEELVGWFSYLERRPVDWRDDDRAMKFLQTQGVKEKPWAIFPSLNPIYNYTKETDPDKLAMKSLRSSVMFSKMLAATGGDQISYD
jgi:hypothetical protein